MTSPLTIHPLVDLLLPSGQEPNGRASTARFHCVLFTRVSSIAEPHVVPVSNLTSAVFRYVHTIVEYVSSSVLSDT